VIQSRLRSVREEARYTEISEEATDALNEKRTEVCDALAEAKEELTEGEETYTQEILDGEKRARGRGG